MATITTTTMAESINLSSMNLSGREGSIVSAPIATRENSRPEQPLESYSTLRKSLIVFAASWMTLAATFSSTSLYSAMNEVANNFQVQESTLSTSNAGVFLAMALSSFFWGPVSAIFGRRPAYNAATLLLFSFSLGTALAPNFATFVAMRTLTGLQGTFFMVAGQTVIADLFAPIYRGTAVGFFTAGTVIGPALGPCTGGIIVTFASWRAIFWLQSAMIALGLVLSFLLIPEVQERQSVGTKIQLIPALAQFNAMRVFRLLLYPNVLLTDLACGLLSWTQYSLLASPRHLINSRFHLTSPLVSGLFYVAPGAGFLLGTIVGGKFADRTVVKRIALRGGLRLPQDRLNSGMLSFYLIVPGASLVYGWGLQFTVGGLALPIIAAFFCGMGVMAAFSSLNTYCAEVIPQKRVQVITGKYFIQYTFAAAGSATIVPLIDTVGVGLATTIGVIFALIGGTLVLTTAKFGLSMQNWVDRKLRVPPRVTVA